MNGVILLDKPPDISSAGALNIVKRLLPRGVKIGHAGTLDPFATGLLVLLVGKSTRRCEELMNAPKEYETTIRLGARSATDDPESEPIETLGATAPDRAVVTDVLKRFIGDIQQTPPAYSAIKIAGRRACDRIRSGESVELKPRTVRVYDIALVLYEWPYTKVRINCGRGTYIRSIARDMGEILGIGAYLTAL